MYTVESLIKQITKEGRRKGKCLCFSVFRGEGKKNTLSLGVPALLWLWGVMSCRSDWSMEMRPTRHFCENWLATLALSSRAVGQVLFSSCNSFYGLRGDERFAHGGLSESMILWIAETFNGQPLYSQRIYRNPRIYLGYTKEPANKRHNR